MKTTLAIASLPAVLLATLATAHAQPSDAPAAPAASDGKVSKLEGQVVPVGDHNRYLYAYKKYNVSTNPMGIIYGSYGVSASYAFSDHVALRGDLNYVAPVGSSDHGLELAVGAPIYFRKMYSGIFLEPGIAMQEVWTGSSTPSGTVAATTMNDTTTVFGPQMLLGYHWYWDSGLNIAVAAGVGRNWNSGGNSDYNKLFPAYYLRFGYAF